MAGHKPSKRFAKYSEIHDALRNAGEYAASMMHHEETAAKALERDGDKADVAEAERGFLKDLKAFIAEVRSARDYMTAAANKTRHDTWIAGRFNSSETAELFEFFNALMNVTLHQYRPKLEPRSNKVQYVGELGSVMLRTPIGSIPSIMRVTGLVDAKYYFTLGDLDARALDAFKKLEKRFPSETVVMLALRYHHALGQILKNAQRNNRFDAVSR